MFSKTRPITVPNPPDPPRPGVSQPPGSPEPECPKPPGSPLTVLAVVTSETLPKPLRPWVICEATGSFLSAHCNCMAGHVGALLFYCEAAARLSASTTCTQQKAKWILPTMNKVEMTFDLSPVCSASAAGGRCEHAVSRRWSRDCRKAELQPCECACAEFKPESDPDPPQTRHRPGTDPEPDLDPFKTRLVLKMDPGSDSRLMKRKHEDEEESPRKKSCDHSAEVADHYNRLQEVGLQVRSQSRIFYMRNFNNWVKSVLIGEILEQLRKSRPGPVRVLDLGCGKGGDLLKWRRGNISHLVCTDIAEVSVDQCRSRFEEMKRKSHNDDIFTAEFITADATKEPLWPQLADPALTFDLCSCQFVVHYSFESQSKAEMMLRNACERLRPGGFFIGTTPDAYELVRRASQSEDLRFGNDVYKVQFKSKPPFSLFGAEYHFSLEGVVDVPEFMVYFPLMTRMLETLGMRLVQKSRFGEFFEQKSKHESHRSLLQKMNALETFPANDGRQATSSDGEYDHVTSESRERPLGTLSRSEWEAASESDTNTVAVPHTASRGRSSKQTRLVQSETQTSSNQRLRPRPIRNRHASSNQRLRHASSNQKPAADSDPDLWFKHKSVLTSSLCVCAGLYLVYVFQKMEPSP
ncbi:hypothetical protein WMY93_019104 [Mugilogobius chulae]|uniref:mRNA (guanine-N(7))-methyltransferase n=1 Tax=Mugilogobius chulae TaxID=88201 RepID=A0AAW0NK87_9GOBI